MLTASTPGDGILQGLPAADLPGPAHRPESFPAHLLGLVPAPTVHALSLAYLLGKSTAKAGIEQFAKGD